MMPSKYSAKNGAEVEFDLDSVVDVIDGWSGALSGWQGFIVYEPRTRVFLELASTVPDVRGNSADKVIEVGDEYVSAQYGLTEQQVASIRERPADWQFLRARSSESQSGAQNA